MMDANPHVPAAAAPTLILGLGKTGYSVVEYLAAQGAALTVADSRRAPPYLAALQQNYPQVALQLGALPRAVDSFERIVISPGLPRTVLPAAAQSRAIGDIELFAQAVSAKLLAITGSNGKSTVTMVVQSMLNAAGYHAVAAGNIGRPVLECLLDPAAAAVDFYALELSSFQLETTQSLAPAAATVLNISADHLDRYADVDAYCRTKQRVLANAAAVVLNRQDARSAALLVAYPQARSFGLDRPAGAAQFGVLEQAGQRYFAYADRRLARLGDMRLRGEQNAANLLAAMALLDAVGVDLSAAVIQAALDYAGLPHRCEVVGEADGVTWINDSKATNVGATLAAIQGAGGTATLLLIAGGQAKQADFTPLAKALAARVSDVILFGQDAAQIEQAVAEYAAAEVRCWRVADLAAAVEVAKTRAQPGQQVLFSPACASFDMFDNFAARGDEFKRLVGALVNA